MDCSVVRLGKYIPVEVHNPEGGVSIVKEELMMISTTDFFYPLIDDPYMQGKIGCANVLSDMYSFGVQKIDNILMILASSNQMTEQQAYISTKLMIKGFRDLALEAGSNVTGGQTVINPWPIIGGTASTVCLSSDYIMPINAVVGDVIVLTKPLGTRIAVNVHQWMYSERWESVKHLITKEKAIEAYEKCIDSMSRLNKTGAILMHKYGAHACTDVTGFGILGHAKNLASNQKADVDFEIHTLPIFENMAKIDPHFAFFKLLAGYAAETSGGLFICLPKDSAELFCAEIESIDQCKAFVIGNVIKKKDPSKPNDAFIVPDPLILNV
eukprot:TRINITY_DN4002_c0_g1_i2.p1 TRINITY_DN4002_c0_g1~~TRINITY_DN4002_c0_g1_i2.p1  ORF type:complete len:326 (+),score=59.18 TRINITY_DN4002_c0_g1_i2:271-1248(+)